MHAVLILLSCQLKSFQELFGYLSNILYRFRPTVDSQQWKSGSGITQELYQSEFLNKINALNNTFIEGSHPQLFHTFKLHNQIMKKQENQLVESQNWKKWEGKVIGTENQIKEALNALGREPKDVQELKRVLFEQSNEKLSKSFEEAKYSPY